MALVTFAAVVLGGVVTILATIAIEKWKLREERQRVENALSEEINLLGEVIEELLVGIFIAEHPNSVSEVGKWTEFEYDHREEDLKTAAHAASFPLARLKIGNTSSLERPIFENIEDKLLLLDEETATPIIQFYASVTALEEHIPDPPLEEYRLAYITAISALDQRDRALEAMNRPTAETDYEYMTSKMGYVREEEEQEEGVERG